MPPAGVDAVVIGGGLIGSSIALRLAQEHLRVVVLEKAEPGREASSAAAGILSPQAESNGPSPFFELGRASRDLYPAWAEELREATGMDVELRLDGVVFVARNEAELQELDERSRRQSKAGDDLKRLSSEDLHRLEPSLRSDLPGGVLIPRDGQVESSRLTRAVIEAASRRGVRFENGNPARRILLSGCRVDGVQASSGVIRTGIVVNAAGAWADFDPTLPFPLPIHPARGEIVAVTADRCPERVIYSHRVYVVPRRGGRILLGATMESGGYDKTVKVRGMIQLTTRAIEVVPGLESARFESTWAGLRPCAPDHLPILGATAIDGLLLAGGHCRNGILLAPVTARLIADLATRGKTAIDLSPFSVSRFEEV